MLSFYRSESNADPGLGRLIRCLMMAACARGCLRESPTLGFDRQKVFCAGASAIDITPQKLPVIVNGGFAEAHSDQVHDPLYARCLVLDDGREQIAITLVDSCVIPQTLLDEAKTLAQQATGLRIDRMLIAATHCHSAPSVMGVLGSSVDEDYAKWLPGRIAEGMIRAYRNRVPARIGWAVGTDSKNVFCRRFVMKPGSAKTNRFSGTRNDQGR